MVESEETPPGNEDDEMAENAIELQPVASRARRRGRRRVMKKKTVKDDEGYLGWFMTPWLILVFLVEP